MDGSTCSQRNKRVYSFGSERQRLFLRNREEKGFRGFPLFLGVD